MRTAKRWYKNSPAVAQPPLQVTLAQWHLGADASDAYLVHSDRRYMFGCHCMRR